MRLSQPLVFNIQVPKERRQDRTDAKERSYSVVDVTPAWLSDPGKDVLDIAKVFLIEAQQPNRIARR